MDFKEFVQTHTIGEIKKSYPQVIDYLDNTGLWNLSDYLANSKDLYYPDNHIHKLLIIWIIQVFGICQII